MSREEDPRVLFGLHLKALRQRRGWSQEDLSLESKLARSYVGEVERGHRNIALVNICILAATFGVPPSEMLNFDAELSAITAAVKAKRGGTGKSVSRRQPGKG